MHGRHPSLRFLPLCSWLAVRTCSPGSIELSQTQVHVALDPRSTCLGGRKCRGEEVQGGWGPHWTGCGARGLFGGRGTNTVNHLCLCTVRLQRENKMQMVMSHTLPFMSKIYGCMYTEYPWEGLLTFFIFLPMLLFYFKCLY